MNKVLTLTLATLGALVLSAPSALALNCGDTVTTSIILNADLNCDSSNGLIVGKSGIAIDLNSHTISCHTVGGYEGSCIKTPSSTYTNYVGIKSDGFSNVIIEGPGTIRGFGVGVSLSHGSALRATSLTITGPPSSVDFPASKRALAVGVLVNQVNCQVSSAFVLAGSVIFNDVSQLTQGVQLENSSCVEVRGNNLHDNAGFSDSHGIDLISSSNNVLSWNTSVRNGAGGPVPDSGITILDAVGGGPSSRNFVFNNFVAENCGDGIVVSHGASFNTISDNFVHNNPGPKCAGGTFFDLTTVAPGPGNTWTISNSCKTEGPGIPAGICQ